MYARMRQESRGRGIAYCCGALKALAARLHLGVEEDETLVSTVWLRRTAGRSALAIDDMVNIYRDVQQGIEVSQGRCIGKCIALRNEL
jgi:hypothetical protein